jgi:C4-dicarboxylate-specific signal transduction histidine kinase
VRNALAEIVEDADRAGAVLRRIRQLAQRTPCERSLLDLRTVTADVLLLARGESSARQVTIRTEQSEELLPVFGDRVQLQQVLLNLNGEWNHKKL